MTKMNGILARGSLLIVVFVTVAQSQYLIDIKKIPKNINADMCQCAASIKTEERIARSRVAQQACEDKLGVPIPDFEGQAREEVKKPLPRGLAQWTRKQVENPGVDYKCLNHLRELYFHQKKLQNFLDEIEKFKTDQYKTCFGQKMNWFKENGQLDKVSVKNEIAGSNLINKKLQQSLEVLSLTCRGNTIDDLESYIKCATKPCADPEFFDLLGKAKPASESTGP
ncbi:unnamed protein product [Notodromas monacha]|uniref:Uncharacterized protein n=1 Tax=Notodromas monacha TaxID=399045 RepID=A0A7R9BFE4_9CRUS|nr:unnamed protein product [Notodromas monacha]CAG0913643.1 unnamed protein product [Notodromas monacha]